MGWLYRNEPIDDPLAYLKAKYNYDCETHTLQTLDGARVRNTVYLAVRSTVKKTGRSFVFAAVILISNTKKHGFGYKDQDKSMGPCECACPQRIIRLLSPIADLPHPGYTAEWRARVAAHHDAAAPDAANGANRSASAASSNCPLPRASPTAQPPASSASLISAAERRFRSSRPARNLLPVTRGDPGGSHDIAPQSAGSRKLAGRPSQNGHPSTATKQTKGRPSCQPTMSISAPMPTTPPASSRRARRRTRFRRRGPFTNEGPEDLMYQSYDGGHPVNEIEVFNANRGSGAVWHDDDRRRRLAASGHAGGAGALRRLPR